MKSQYSILVIVFLLMLLTALPNNVQEWEFRNEEMGSRTYISQQQLWGHEETGPWVDSIVVESYENEEEMILALIDGDIDACADSVSLDYIDQLNDAENVALTRMPKNGYGLLNINCEKYPLNITGFRRALAYALDKETLCQEVWGELAQPHDSCVPTMNYLSIEDQLNGLYYEADLITAGELLDVAGFIDVDNDGFREAPNGSALEISVYDFHQDEHSREVCLIVVDTLRSMSIRSELVEFHQNFQSGFQLCRNYDLSFNVQNFNSFALDELFAEYLSTNLENPNRNLPRFANSTYDTIAKQSLYCTDYSRVRMATSTLQEIILYECPIIVCYEPLDVYAYRTDDFCYDCDYVAADFWRTCYKAYRKSGDVIGGTFTFGVLNNLELIIPFETPRKLWDILSLSFDSLFRIDINGQLKNGVAYDYKFQNHSDNSNIPLGHCRCKVRIPKLWGWIDGSPLTALDVAQSFNYFREVDCGWLSKGMEDLTAVFSLNSVDLILEFNTESFWDFYNIVTKPIIPIHYFKEKGIGDLSNWELDPHDVGDFPDCGAFILKAWVRNHFLEFEQNPNSPYNPRLLCGPGQWILELPPDGYYTVISHPQGGMYERSPTSYVYHNIPYFTMEYELYINGTSFMEPHPTYWLDPTAHKEYHLFTIRINNLTAGIFNITVKTSCLIHKLGTATVIIKVPTEDEIARRALMGSLVLIIAFFAISFILTIGVGIVILKRMDPLQSNQKSLKTHSHS